MPINDVCGCFLGVIPSPAKLYGKFISNTWLDEFFKVLPEEALNLDVQNAIGALILKLIGSNEYGQYA